MEFRQFKDGSGEIVFSWKERFTFLFKGKLKLGHTAFKDFGAALMHMAVSWNRVNDKK
jgi:hypothetical protein